MPVTATHYEELLREFPLRPIRSDRQLARASELASRLSVKLRMTAGERDYLEVLAGLIQRYEDEAHAITRRSGPEMLAFLIEENGSTLAAIAATAGMRPSALAEAIEGQRDLTLAQIRALAGHFRVSPALLLST